MTALIDKGVPGIYSGNQGIGGEDGSKGLEFFLNPGPLGC